MEPLRQYTFKRLTERMASAFSVMNPFKRLSLRNRIIFGFSFLTFSVVLVMAVISYHTVRAVYAGQLKEQVSQLAAVLGGELDPRFLPFLVPGGAGGPVDYYTAYLEKKARQAGIGTAFIFSNDYKIHAASDNLTDGSFLELSRYELEKLHVGESTGSVLFQDMEGNWYLWGFYRISPDFYLGVREEARRISFLDQLLNYFMLIGLAGLLLTVLLAGVIARHVSAPIQQLIGFSRHIGKGDFEKPAPEMESTEVTVLRDAMEQMRHDLSAQHREREQLLAQIAHEIRNPLGGIELLIGLIREESEGHESINAKARTIQKETAELKKYIAAFLELNKPLEPVREMVESEKVITEVKTALEELIRRKEVRWETDLARGRVFFDRSHLRQIILNLVKNALEAVDSGGRVLVRSGYARGSFLIQVCNSGTAIAREVITELFKPFFTTKANGSGLGLAISKKLCTLNGAVLYLEPAAEMTTFTIEIPMKAKSNE